MSDYFKNILSDFKDSDRPEKIRTFEEILKCNKIANKYEFSVLYKSISEEQKYNAVKLAIWSLQKHGKSLAEILNIFNNCHDYGKDHKDNSNYF